VSEVHVRALRTALVLVIAACVLPGAANAATVTIDAVAKPNKVTRADVANGVQRYRLFYGTKATLAGVVTRDDGAPAAGVTVTIWRQYADASDPAGFRTIKIGDVVTDAKGAYTRLVKPDRISYYYGEVAALPDAGIATPARSPRVGLLVAAKLVQTSDPHQKGAIFTVRGRVLMPGSRSLGRILVERLKGTTATKKAQTLTNADGTFSVGLRHTKNGTYRYRLSYVPKDGNRLISSSLIFSITVTAIQPPAP
jgi:hypothetical protein